MKGEEAKSVGAKSQTSSASWTKKSQIPGERRVCKQRGAKERMAGGRSEFEAGELRPAMVGGIYNCVL